MWRLNIHNLNSKSDVLTEYPVAQCDEYILMPYVFENKSNKNKKGQGPSGSPKYYTILIITRQVNNVKILCSLHWFKYTCNLLFGCLSYIHDYNFMQPLWKVNVFKFGQIGINIYLNSPFSQDMCHSKGLFSTFIESELFLHRCTFPTDGS